MAVLRCKMRVAEVTQLKDAYSKLDQERVKLVAVYSSEEGSENKKWCTWTPYAEFVIGINNPEAFNKLSAGHEFFVDFIPVEE